MVEEAKTPSKRGKGETVQVIVEMRMPKAKGPGFALQMASGLTVTGFQLDTEYEPVPVAPSSKEVSLAPDLEAKREEIVLVRGVIEKEKIEDLKKQPNVIDVWTDAKIAPFEKEEFSDNVMLAPEVAFGTCPIPPCDCDPGTPKGEISDVAKYLGVDKIWNAGYRGKGMVIGVADGGITAEGRVTGGKISNVIGGWPADWGTKDLWNHGNMCAKDALGMAPEASLYDLRIASDTVEGMISNAIQAYEWAIQQHKKDGTPHVLTNSWGLFQKSWDVDYATKANHPFTKKVEEAINEGILVLFAAGNCGEACPDSRCKNDNGPGKSIWGANGHPAVMTVGAANTEGKLIGYSSQGPASLDEYKPDFCSISHFKGYFSSDSGTSAACPIAAGVVALLKQYKPSYTQSAVKQDLKNSANNIGPAGWDQHSGSGIIQPFKLVEVAEEASPCDKYKEQASEYQEAYKKTNDTRYLCYYYYYMAQYYSCMYQETDDQKYLCYNYYYLALYYRCIYQVTNNQKYLCYYYYYLAQYYCCMYRVADDKRYLCYCYYYMAMYYRCLYQMTTDQKYLALYQQYMAAYRNCIQ